MGTLMQQRSDKKIIVVHNNNYRRCQLCQWRKEKLNIFQILTILVVLLLSSSCVIDAFTLKMGLLKVGHPKTWDASKSKLHYIRTAGVRQFISTYNRVKDLKGDDLFWGDE